RALLEPGKQGRDPLEAAMVVDAALRRCAGRLATLQHNPGIVAEVPAETLRVWRDWIGRSMRRLAAGDTLLPPRPLGTENETLLRFARQIELIGGAMERLGPEERK
ncbi:MAG TPA: FUSC family protein, partial [Rhodopila sp.]|nr:FUSC family protein [Rhodopila sp.]